MKKLVLGKISNMHATIYTMYLAFVHLGLSPEKRRSHHAYSMPEISGKFTSEDGEATPDVVSVGYAFFGRRSIQ
ncbi:hypothetical protein Trydic_g12147 [Trypoxylus dichotomus]